MLGGLLATGLLVSGTAIAGRWGLAKAFGADAYKSAVTSYSYKGMTGWIRNMMVGAFATSRNNTGKVISGGPKRFDELMRSFSKDWRKMSNIAPIHKNLTRQMSKMESKLNAFESTIRGSNELNSEVKKEINDIFTNTFGASNIGNAKSFVNEENIKSVEKALNEIGGLVSNSSRLSSFNKSAINALQQAQASKSLMHTTLNANRAVIAFPTLSGAVASYSVLNYAKNKALNKNKGGLY